MAVALVVVGATAAVRERPRHAEVARPFSLAPGGEARGGAGVHVPLPVAEVDEQPPPSGRPATTAFTPVRVVVPALGLQADLDPEGAPGAALAIPSGPLSRWAWWDGGARPMEPGGPILLAGHKDRFGVGEGPADRILDLRPGQVAYLYGAAGQWEAFTATALAQVPKSGFAAWSRAELGPGGPNRLVIVTCGGTFDPWVGHWDSNVIATFAPALPA